MPAVSWGVRLEFQVAAQGIFAREARAMTTWGRFAMTAPSPPRSSFAVLDRLILEALSELRSARAAAARRGDRENLDVQLRAEEHLNALLDYRHVAQGR
jgi:hypothetical protein